MTQTLALHALYQAVFTRLAVDHPTEDWGDRVYPDLAPSGSEKPYVIYWWLGGGELNQSVVRDAEIVLGVKVVALELVQAFTLAGRLGELLNDADRSSSKALDAGAEWVVQHTMQEGAVHLVEQVDGTWVYHEGFRLRCRMEAVG